jgi:ribosomal protein L7/L12
MERGYWLNPGEIPTEEDVKRLVSGEHKINAIKLYRELNPGVSLQEAKDRVEQMAAASV